MRCAYVWPAGFLGEPVGECGPAIFIFVLYLNTVGTPAKMIVRDVFSQNEESQNSLLGCLLKTLKIVYEQQLILIRRVSVEKPLFLLMFRLIFLTFAFRVRQLNLFWRLYPPPSPERRDF